MKPTRSWRCGRPSAAATTQRMRARAHIAQALRKRTGQEPTRRAVLSALLKKAVEWGELERLPCVIKLLPNPKKTMGFHDFDRYERLLRVARKRGTDVYVMVLAGGDAGLRLGEIVALEWCDIDLKARRLRAARNGGQGGARSHGPRVQGSNDEGTSNRERAQRASHGNGAGIEGSPRATVSGVWGRSPQIKIDQAGYGDRNRLTVFPSW